MGSEDDVLDDGDVVVPADLPLEAIAEEVQNSWHLKVRSSHIRSSSACVTGCALAARVCVRACVRACVRVKKQRQGVR